jgi:hypothetical protein
LEILLKEVKDKGRKTLNGRKIGKRVAPFQGGHPTDTSR